MYTIEEFDEAKTRILKYILYKKRTEKEVRIKFENSMQQELLNDVIEYLKEAKYIDDNEYIEKTINQFFALKNLSLKEVKYKLLAKGIEKNKMEDYFNQNKEEMKEYEIKSASNIVYKKSSSMEQEEIKQYLIKKGYTLESIQQAMEEIE